MSFWHIRPINVLLSVCFTFISSFIFTVIHNYLVCCCFSFLWCLKPLELLHGFSDRVRFGNILSLNSVLVVTGALLAVPHSAKCHEQASINVRVIENPSPFERGVGEEAGRSLLAHWDFLPCVTLSVIAMSHFKDFMWADGWSTTRESAVVKIPINEGQRNMTWAAPGPYLAVAEPVDWKCIPSAPSRGSVLSVGAGRLHFSCGSFPCPWATSRTSSGLTSGWGWSAALRKHLSYCYAIYLHSGCYSGQKAYIPILFMHSHMLIVTSFDNDWNSTHEHIINS